MINPFSSRRGHLGRTYVFHMEMMPIQQMVYIDGYWVYCSREMRIYSSRVPRDDPSFFTSFPNHETLARDLFRTYHAPHGTILDSAISRQPVATSVRGIS